MPTVFNRKAPKLMGDLIRDLSITPEQAGGIVGNIGHECGGFLLMQEVHPVAGAGGYGWCQWTGPRRRTFFAWCKANNLSVDSDEGNYGYLLHELRTTEAAAVKAIKKHTSLGDCVVAFEQAFERAGVKSYKDRIQYGALALAAYTASLKAPAPAPAPAPAKPAPAAIPVSAFPTPAAAAPAPAQPAAPASKSIWDYVRSFLGRG